MTRGEWIESVIHEEGVDDAVFRITRGCDRCGYYLPDDDGFHCKSEKYEEICRIEHAAWLEDEMDY